MHLYNNMVFCKKVFIVSPKQHQMLSAIEPDKAPGKLIPDEDVNVEEERWRNE
jgi:hypothetical protein